MAPQRITTRAASLALVAAAAALGGCGGASMERVDPRADDDVGGTFIDSADVIAVTDRAAADLSKVLLQSPKNDLVLVMSTIKNESLQPMNTALLTDRLRDKLVHETAPRVKSVAREFMDEVLAEREGKREGVLTERERKALLGADYLLTGRINSLSKRYEGDRADYFQLGFTLLDAEDATIVWSNQYEFKKVGDAGVIYQ
jgi:PBP1b-binding outer membrane lipoprotein LpoB